MQLLLSPNNVSNPSPSCDPIWQKASSTKKKKPIADQVQFFSKTLSIMLGALVLSLFVVVLMTSLNLHDIALWSTKVLGFSFIALLSGLSFLSLYGLVRTEHYIRQGRVEKLWLEAAFQGANGITTLALTFTLLGISLGIGSLAEQSLTPDTIQEVTKGLTAKFALAFMTTVIGLPLSTFLRGILSITHVRMEKLEQQLAEQRQA